MRQLTEGLQARLTKLEGDVTAIDEFLTEVENDEVEESEEETAPATVVGLPAQVDTVTIPATGMSRRKKAAYTIGGLGTLGALALAAFNRQAVADAAVSIGTAAT